MVLSFFIKGGGESWQFFFLIQVVNYDNNYYRQLSVVDSEGRRRNFSTHNGKNVKKTAFFSYIFGRMNIKKVEKRLTIKNIFNFPFPK